MCYTGSLIRSASELPFYLVRADNEPSGGDRAVEANPGYAGEVAGAPLEADEADKFAAHQARRQYRRTCERPNKGNKAIERDVLSSYQVAQSLGFNGDFRAWEHLLRIYE